MDPVLDYHERSKHHLNHYAPGPEGLDWATQPEPFRRYTGVLELELPLLAGELQASWDDLFAPANVLQQQLNADSVANLFQLSLGLSAWKSFDGSRWALRCNPSSGNLHPTESYLICSVLPGLPAGVYHYGPERHCLERRAAAAFTWSGGIFVALTGIYWREAWKYGMRAFRYCQHDCGHAMAAISYAAAVLGWPVRLLADWGDHEIGALSGVDRSTEFSAKEGETPEALLWVGPGAVPDRTAVMAALANAEWAGEANALSADHHDWPQIRAVAAATKKSTGTLEPIGRPVQLQNLAPASHEPASRLIRRRRSAQAFDGLTIISKQRFYRILDALLPRAGNPPWVVQDQAPSVHPVLFLHRVNGLEPGIYCLPRSPKAFEEMRSAMRPDWLWARVEGCPEHLPLRLLAPLDTRHFAAMASCHQAIAANSAFAVAMLARFDDIGRSQPWIYRQRFWEAGILGQILYMEAEAADIQGTGIGCYFDDEVHRVLGIDTKRFQDIYHFTVGTAVPDRRLGSEPAYEARHRHTPIQRKERDERP